MNGSFVIRWFYALALCLFSISSTAQGDTVHVRELTRKSAGFLNTSPDSILFYASNALRLAEQIHDERGIAEAHSNIGNYYWVKGNYADALSHYTISFDVYNKMGDKKGAAKILSNYGMVYSFLGHPTKAVHYFLESLRLAETTGDAAVIGKTYNNLGMVFKNQQRYAEAIEAFTQAQILSKEANDYMTFAGTFTNLGSIYQSQHDLTRAVEHHKKALHLFDSLQSIRGRLSCYTNLGEVFYLLKVYKEAKRYYQEALALSRANGFPSHEVSALQGLANINHASKNYDEAIQQLLQAVSIAEPKHSRPELVSLYKGLAYSYRELKRFDQAFYYYNKYSELKDSLFNHENVSTIANLRLAYDLEKKEADIALLTKDKKIAMLGRNMILIVAGGVFLLFVLFIILLRQRIKKDRKLMEQQAELHEAKHAMVKTELENQKIREEELKKELDFRSRTLTTYTLNLVQKNGMLNEVKAIIQEVLKSSDRQEVELKKLIRLIDYSFTLDKDWEGFKTYFEQIHPDFFKELKENYPQLTGTELRLCALIRLSLSIKEAASILSISPDSVKVARHRLRKKLNLTTDDNLTEFIMAVGAPASTEEKDKEATHM